MAIITVRFRSSANRRINYAFRQQEPGDPVDSQNVSSDKQEAKASYKAVREANNYTEGKQVFEVIQSWGPDESKNLTKEEVNQMGMELAKKYFEGFQFLVVTHTNRPNWHNHIVVNKVNMETGKLLCDKFEHRWELMKINDEICLKRGLSVPNRRFSASEDYLPEKVRQMQRFRGHSYILDTMEKADFARKYATSYDEYGAILGEFGIRVRVEPKNITYYYPGFDQGKRGRYLGAKYNKPYLERAFKTNDESFQSKPEARLGLRDGIESMRSQTGESLKFKPKDYSQFTKIRRGEKIAYPSDSLNDSIIPFGEIQRARGSNILEYCRKNKIAVLTNNKGQSVMKGRPYVVLGDTSWTNTKNNTQGSLIELVAAHKNCSFLSAISKINNNPRLLLLEKHFGEEKRVYQSFYIPKPERADLAKTTKQLGKFLHSHGANSGLAGGLLKTGQVQVDKNGLLRLFPVGEPVGALEFVEGKDGAWSKTAKGEKGRPFFSSPGKTKGQLFLDPLAFIKTHGENVFLNSKKPSGILALMGPNFDEVDKYLGQNQDITKLFLVPSHHDGYSKVELDFFENLKKRYGHLGVHIEATTLERARSHEGRTLGI